MQVCGKRIKSFLWALPVFFLLLSFADANSPQTPVAFVQSFYADLQTAESVSAIDRTGKLKNYFDDNLYQLLLQDDKNRENNINGICGFLNFDAFVNSADGNGTVKKVELVQNYPAFLVAVTFDQNTTPDLYVQLKADKAAWKITNLLYPNAITKKNSSLIALLETAQKQTCKPSANVSSSD